MTCALLSTKNNQVQCNILLYFSGLQQKKTNQQTHVLFVCKASNATDYNRNTSYHTLLVMISLCVDVHFSVVCTQSEICVRLKLVDNLLTAGREWSYIKNTPSRTHQRKRISALEICSNFLLANQHC